MSLVAIADTTNRIMLFWIAVTLIAIGIFKDVFWIGIVFMIIWTFISLSAVVSVRVEKEKLK